MLIITNPFIEKHNGKIPSNMEDLVQLPGVGRKTANVVLGTGFKIPGIVVDTHVTRLSNLLKFFNHTMQDLHHDKSLLR